MLPGQRWSGSVGESGQSRALVAVTTALQPGPGDITELEHTPHTACDQEWMITPKGQGPKAPALRTGQALRETGVSRGWGTES